MSLNSGTADKSIVGVLANGVPIYSGASGRAQYDALIASQNLITGATQIDNCLGALSPEGLYKYHCYSPCVWESAFKTSLTTPALCNSIVACKRDALAYARA
jgi:hypothetical protein